MKNKKNRQPLAGPEGNAPETFRMLLEHAAEGSVILTGEGRISYASRAANAILGYPDGGLAGTLLFELSHPEDLATLRYRFSQMLAMPETRTELPACRMRHQDGSYRWIESALTNMLGIPAIGGVLQSFRDVTKSRAVHERLIYTRRLYDFLRKINHAIVHSSDENVLFNAACRIAVEHVGFGHAWIGIPDRSSGKVTMAASAGNTRRDIEFFSNYSYDPEGPISKVLGGLDYYAVDHIQSRNNRKFIAYANERGFQSAIVLPLKKSGTVFAVMSLYATGKRFFDAAEASLLTEASSDLSFALEVLERDSERAKAVRALEQKELRLSQAQQIANLGSWDYDFASGTSHWSDQALHIYGFDTLGGSPSYGEWFSRVHPKDQKRVAAIIKNAESDQQGISFFHRIMRPDGTVRHVRTQSLFTSAGNSTPGGLSGIVHDITDLRNQELALRAAEDAFRQSESRYRQIVENAHEGIWLLDKSDRTIFANGKMCEILGCAPELMPGRKFLSFVGGEFHGDLSDTEAHTAMVPFKTSAGEIIWANVAFGPLMETGRLALVSDITEKKALEELLENATSMARIGGYELDIASATMSWSSMTRDIHEVKASFAPTLENAMAFYKEGASREALVEAGYRALKEGIPWDLEVEIVTARGNARWVRVIGKPEHRNGRCVKIYGSFQDIDSRKQAELEVLRIAEEKNRILESIGDAFFAVDAQWNVTYWNKEAENLLKRKRSDAIGRNLWELYPETVGTDYFTYYSRAARDNTVQHFETLYEPMQMWTEVSAYPSPSGLSVYFKDVTQRKQAEAERAGMLSEIMRRNENLEQFSYIVSHNLRGPVANMMGIARELESGGNSPAAEKMLKEGLSVSASRLDEVIIDLSAVLQLRARTSENMERVSLNGLVSGIRDSIIDLVRAEGAVISTDFSAIDELFSVKSYLYSIFYNLILNSIKYRQADLKPLIEIRSAVEGSRITITFKDNGLGIDLAAKKDQVFGLYKRFHSHVDGKGLGLFMVKTQAEILGGTVSIASQVGRGTEITLRLGL